MELDVATTYVTGTFSIRYLDELPGGGIIQRFKQRGRGGGEGR